MINFIFKVPQPYINLIPKNDAPISVKVCLYLISSLFSIMVASFIPYLIWNYIIIKSFFMYDLPSITMLQGLSIFISLYYIKCTLFSDYKDENFKENEN